jgi:hypothetical protein
MAAISASAPRASSTAETDEFGFHRQRGADVAGPHRGDLQTQHLVEADALLEGLDQFGVEQRLFFSAAWLQAAGGH